MFAAAVSGRRTLAGLVFTLALAGPLAADEGQNAAPLDRKVLDQRLAEHLRKVTNEGAQRYNKVSYAAGFYFFEGALTTVEPLLDHRPSLQRIIKKGLTDANRLTSMEDKAWALRDVLVTVRRSLEPEPPEPRKPGAAVWDRAGGEATVKRIISDWIDFCLEDPKVNFSRNGKFKLTAAQVQTVKERTLDLASAALGGPRKAPGRPVKEIHRGMEITDAEFDAAAANLKKALFRNGVLAEDVQLVMAAVGTTRPDIVDRKENARPPAKTLWDRVGGEAMVRKIVGEFVDAAVADPKVNFSRAGKFKLGPQEVATLKEKIVDLASSVTGGPRKYTGKTMKEVHKDMGITDAEFTAMAAHLKVALTRNNVAAADVLIIMTAVGSTRRDVVEK